MGLLGDFLLGAITQGGPRVMADMDQREREQRMREERAAEIERQRRIQLEDYDRARRDRQADFEAQQKAIAERERLQEEARARGLLANAQRQAELRRQEHERIAGLQTQSSTGVTDTQMAGIRQGINPFGGETEDGVMPDEIAANKERFLKVTQEYNRNLLNVAQGVKPDEALKLRRDQEIDRLVNEGNLDEAERRARIYRGGRTQAEVDAQVDSARARADKARADAQAPRSSGGGGGGSGEKLTPATVLSDARQAAQQAARQAQQAREDLDKLDKAIADAQAEVNKTKIPRLKSEAQARLDQLNGRRQTLQTVYDEAVEMRRAADADAQAARRTLAEGGTGREALRSRIGMPPSSQGQGAAPAAATTKTYPPAPQDKAQRTPGTIYDTPRGPLRWTGRIWETV